MIGHSPWRTRQILGVILLTGVAVSLLCVVYPIYVIRPFRAQGARELAAALVVTRFRPAATAISAVVVTVALALYWRVQSRISRRILPAVGVVVACVLAVLARVNVYELMFHPIVQASFSSTTQTKLDRDEKVIAVKIGDLARAYPIRSMSYHHLINDVVNKLAIVATY